MPSSRKPRKKKKKKKSKKSHKAPASSRKTSKKTSRKDECPGDQIRNPDTGRCVLKTGVIGKRVLAAQQAAKKPKSSRKPRAPKNKCKKYAKSKDPKCDEQEGCKWIVGTGCIESQLARAVLEDEEVAVLEDEEEVAVLEEEEVGTCAICLESIEEGQKTKSCHSDSNHPHTFHETCIDQWLELSKRNECPLCRETCLPDDEFRQVLAAGTDLDAQTALGLIIALEPAMHNYQAWRAPLNATEENIETFQTAIRTRARAIVRMAARELENPDLVLVRDSQWNPAWTGRDHPAGAFQTIDQIIEAARVVMASPDLSPIILEMVNNNPFGFGEEQEAEGCMIQ